MKTQWISYLLPITAGCIGIMLCAIILYSRNQKNSLPVSISSGPQCAHWSIFRTAQLLGIPTAPGGVQRLLSNQSQGIHMHRRQIHGRIVGVPGAVCNILYSHSQLRERAADRKIEIPGSLLGRFKLNFSQRPPKA